MSTSKSFIVSSLIFKSLIHFELYFLFDTRVQFHSLACEYTVFSSPSFEDTILYPLCTLRTLFKDHLTKYFWVYFCSFYFVALVCMAVFMPLPHSFDYCSSVIHFGVRSCEVSNFFLLSQGCFGYSESFVFPH